MHIKPFLQPLNPFGEPNSENIFLLVNAKLNLLSLPYIYTFNWKHYEQTILAKTTDLKTKLDVVHKIIKNEDSKKMLSANKSIWNTTT